MQREYSYYMDQEIKGSFEGDKRRIQSLKAKADARRGNFEKMADGITETVGSSIFLALNVAWFTVWITINLGFLPELAVFDPFPFGLLTMIVSLEAIVLSIFVLMSQNRAARISDIREELNLQLEKISEQELTKVLELLAKLLEKNKIDVSGDALLQQMLKPTNTNRIEQVLEKQVSLPNSYDILKMVSGERGKK